MDGGAGRAVWHLTDRDGAEVFFAVIAVAGNELSVYLGRIFKFSAN